MSIIKIIEQRNNIKIKNNSNLSQSNKILKIKKPIVIKNYNIKTNYFNINDNLTAIKNNVISEFSNIKKKSIQFENDNELKTIINKKIFIVIASFDKINITKKVIYNIKYNILNKNISFNIVKININTIKINNISKKYVIVFNTNNDKTNNNLTYNTNIINYKYHESKDNTDFSIDKEVIFQRSFISSFKLSIINNTTNNNILNNNFISNFNLNYNGSYYNDLLIKTKRKVLDKIFIIDNNIIKF